MSGALRTNAGGRRNGGTDEKSARAVGCCGGTDERGGW